MHQCQGDYTGACYHFGADEVLAKVLMKYPTLWLDFLDERSDNDDDAEAQGTPIDSLGDLPPIT